MTRIRRKRHGVSSSRSALGQVGHSAARLSLCCFFTITDHMHLRRFHSLAGITVIILIACTVANFFAMEWHRAPISYAVASVLLASPFAVLLWAHVTIAQTWRRNLYLAIGSVLFIVPWLFISFAMRWFQGGWYGIAVGSAVMIALAGGYLSLALLIGEKSSP